jgi:mono/diheme cytochrome c family protein
MIRSVCGSARAATPPRGQRAVHALLAALVSILGCGDDDDWRPEALAFGHGTALAAELRAGRGVYARYCVGCHGPAGDGNGPAARQLDPKPRDFRIGAIKFAAVPAGELPRDEDLLRVVTEGLHGTAMPSWRLLSLADRRAVIAYIKAFSPAYADRPPGIPVALGKDPWRRFPDQGIAEGEQVYHGIAACTTCHPAYLPRARIADHRAAYDLPVGALRDDLYRSVAKDSQWGAPILPPDFLVDRIKTGADPDSLVRVIAAGVGGTAMPTWAGGLSDRQLWGLAYYVESLARLRGTREGRALQAALWAQPPGEAPQAPPADADERGGLP